MKIVSYALTIALAFLVSLNHVATAEDRPLIIIREAFVAFNISIVDGRTNNDNYTSNALSVLLEASNQLSAEVAEETFGSNRRMLLILDENVDYEENLSKHVEKLVTDKKHLHLLRGGERHRRRLTVMVFRSTSFVRADQIDCPASVTNANDLCLGMIFIVGVLFMGEKPEDIPNMLQEYESNLSNAISESRLQQALDEIGTTSVAIVN